MRDKFEMDKYHKFKDHQMCPGCFLVFEEYLMTVDKKPDKHFTRFKSLFKTKNHFHCHSMLNFIDKLENKFGIYRQNFSLIILHFKLYLSTFIHFKLL